MNKTYLILQILGINDIYIGEKSIFEKIRQAYTLEDIKEELTTLYEENQIRLPFIEQIIDKFYTEKNGNSELEKTQLIFGIILTDQKKWVESAEEKWGHSSDDVWKLIAKDGIWHQEILKQWFERFNNNDIVYHPLPLTIEADAQYGVGDWEQMSNYIEELLDKNITKKNDRLEFANLSIDKLIIQHSSGTPALTNALYLWGIKQKLGESYVNIRDSDRQEALIEFVYISELEETCKEHSGEHWQWHLRLPIVRELISVQDFSGAAILVKEAPKNWEFKAIENELNYLDLSVSFNLLERAELEKELLLNDRDDVLERIAIALWSEKAFRLRHHWMHWYLRIAGAFELAILSLVEYQGKGQYEWQDKKLIFESDRKQVISKASIKNIVSELLTNGQLSYRDRNYSVDKVTDSKWIEFKKFYVDKWKDIDLELGFIATRNSLYHKLIGDDIDAKLTKNESASKKIIESLKYILNLAGILNAIEAKINRYQERVDQLKQKLY